MKRLLLLAMLAALISCRAKPVVLEVVPEPTSRVGAKVGTLLVQSVAALSATETPYNATGFYVGMLRQIADGEEVDWLHLYDGRVIKFDDRICTTTIIGLGFYPRAQPILGDWDGDGELNILDLLNIRDRILGRK